MYMVHQIGQTKNNFFNELSNLKKIVQTSWIILRDFNVTQYPKDMQGQFSSTSSSMAFNKLLNELEVIKNHPLYGRSTWSNFKANPSLAQ